MLDKEYGCSEYDHSEAGNLLPYASGQETLPEGDIPYPSGTPLEDFSLFITVAVAEALALSLLSAEAKSNVLMEIL